MPIELDLLVVAYAIFAGLVGGLMPGVGNLMSMLMVAPFVPINSAFDAIVFFTVLTQISQYVGSLTTIYTGLPGEASSMPTVQEVKKLNKSQLSDVIAASAVGSAFGAVFAVTACLALSYYFADVVYVFRTEVILTLLLVAVYMICKTSSNHWLLSTALLAAGVLISQVGWNNITNSGFLTFGYMDLYQGIPAELVLLMLFALPQLHQLTQTSSRSTRIDIAWSWPALNYVRLSWYSLLGFVGGLMPGLTTVFSSQLAYGYASGRTQDPRERIIASETANNSGAVTQIIPLLVLGLPLVPSEAFTLSMMEIKGFIPSATVAAEYFQALVPVLAIAVVAGLALAWPLAHTVLKILNTNINLFRISMIVVLIGSILYQSVLDANTQYVTLCALAMLPAAWLVRKLDTMTLVFGFFIGSRLIDHVLRFGSLHF